MGAVPSAVQLSIDAGSQHGKSSTQLPMVSMRLHLDLHVASKSSVKLIAAQHAVERCFPKPVKVSVQGHNSPSNVRSQPVGDEETLLGCVALATHNRFACTILERMAAHIAIEPCFVFGMHAMSLTTPHSQLSCCPQVTCLAEGAASFAQGCSFEYSLRPCPCC